MPDSLEAKKAELEKLYEEFKFHTDRMLEIMGEFPRAVKPLVTQEFGIEGLQVGFEMLGKFAGVCKGIEAHSKLGSDSNRAN